MLWIDSSVFLESALGQARAGECEALLERVKKGEKAWTSDYNVYSIVLVMLSKKATVRSVTRFIEGIYSLDSLIVYRPSLEDIKIALDIAVAKHLDFDDSLAVACMRSLEIRKIATLDAHFKKAGVELELPI